MPGMCNKIITGKISEQIDMTAMVMLLFDLLFFKLYILYIVLNTYTV